MEMMKMIGKMILGLVIVAASIYIGFRMLESSNLWISLGSIIIIIPASLGLRIILESDLKKVNSF